MFSGSSQCTNNLFDFVIKNVDHYCYSPRYNHCPACEYKRKLDRLKKEGKILGYIATGGRYEDIIIFKTKDPINAEDYMFCYRFLPATGVVKSVTYDEIGVNGIITLAYGEVEFYPEGEVIAEGSASVHGACKVRKNQSYAIIVAKKPEVWEKENNIKLRISSEGSYDSCLVAVKKEGIFYSIVMEGLILDKPKILKIYPADKIKVVKQNKNTGYYPYFYGIGCKVDKDLKPKVILGGYPEITKEFWLRELKRCYILEQL